MAAPLKVKFIATDGLVWQGEASTVLVRTTEGDIGILPGHVPLMALLVPHGAEVLTTDGVRKIIAVDSGVISVFENNVSVLSAYSELADEISVDRARIELAAMSSRISSAEVTDAEKRNYRRLQSQIKAAEKYEKLSTSQR